MVRYSSDYSGLYDDGYDNFVESEALKMTKSKKPNVNRTAEPKAGRLLYCSGCGCRQMIDGKCRKCGYVPVSPSKKPVSNKPDSENTTTK